MAEDTSRRPRHLLRIFSIWLLLTAVALPLVIFVAGPNMVPGRAGAQAANQSFVNTVLAAVVTPIVLFVATFFIYCLVAFRERGSEPSAEPPLRGNRRAMAYWISHSIVVIAFLFAFGTYEWIIANPGSGGGQGADPLSRPPGKPLEVQAIGQQWAWTFRYPSYGGVESTELVLPAGRYVEVHVTSLDVVHSFWVIEQAIKADAVPGADNIVYVRPDETGSLTIRCAELCGLWHGQMFTEGRVVTPARFDAWATRLQSESADITRHLPAYDHVYFPPPNYRAD